MENLVRTPDSPPQILPLPDGTARPLWSVMIPAYNNIGYIEKTILSVLQQDRGIENMQIEVVDDFSKDGDLGSLVDKLANGRVGYYRQPVNVGSLRNFETCINRSRGQYVHILHGDDFVLDGFYDAMEGLFSDFPTIGAAFSNYDYMDENGDRTWDSEKLTNPRGILTDFLRMICSNQLIQFAAIVVKRSTYEALGSFYGVDFGEDWEMWARIGANYPVGFAPATLAKYRIHNSNLSAHNYLSGKNLKDMDKVLATIESYLPPEWREETMRTARRNVSKNFSRLSHKIYKNSGSAEAALVQLKGALKLHVNPVSVLQALKLRIKIALHNLRVRKAHDF